MHPLCPHLRVDLPLPVDGCGLDYLGGELAAQVAEEGLRDSKDSEDIARERGGVQQGRKRERRGDAQQGSGRRER